MIGLRPQRQPQRVERFAETFDRLVAAGHDFFQLLAETRLAAFAEIGRVLRPQVERDVGNNKRKHAADHAVAPPVQHPRHGATALAAKQRRAIRIFVFEIVGDRPGIDDRGIAVEQHRHFFRAMRRDHAFLGEAPRDGFRRQPLVRQRHPRPPAERAERAGGIGADEFVEFEGHCGILREQQRSYKHRHCDCAALAPRNRIPDKAGAETPRPSKYRRSG